MNLEDKINRVKELKKERFLSDEEIAEIEKLQEEIELEKNPKPRAKPNPYHEEPEESRQKRTIFEFAADKIREKRGLPRSERKPKKGLGSLVWEKIKGKPVTIEEIEQLKLKAVKARLQADIAKNKAVRDKARGESLNNIFGSGRDSGNDKIMRLLGDKRDSEIDREKAAYRRKTLGKSWKI